MKIGTQNKRSLAPSFVKKSRGFTIVEMTVALGIFTIVLFLASSAFFSIVNADRKSRVIRIGMDNLNLALEDMSRKIKTGTTYKCSDGVGVGDCVLSNSTLSFSDQNGQRVTYRRAYGRWSIPIGCGDDLYAGARGCILRAGADGIFKLVTSPEIDIKELKFWVSGSSTYLIGGDKRQPAVVISISGYIGPTTAVSSNQAGKSAFRVQTTVTQSVYDKY